jgi:hypothetical protein
MPRFSQLSTFPASVIASPGLGATLDIGHAFIAKYQAREADPEGATLNDVRQLNLDRLIQ